MHSYSEWPGFDGLNSWDDQRPNGSLARGDGRCLAGWIWMAGSAKLGGVLALLN